MSATISDPFLLSNYGISEKFPFGRGDHSSSVFVTHDRGGANEGYATVAVPGDGIHVLDVSDLHLVDSYALGPSTGFSSPAVSRSRTEHGAGLRKTYVVAGSSPDVKEGEVGRTVWMWSEAPQGGKTQEKRKSVLMPHKISGLHTPDGLSEVYLLSPNGELTVTDVDLKVLSTESSTSSDGVLLKSIVFTPSSTTFATSPSSVTVVSFITVGKRLRIRVVSSGAEGIMMLLDEDSKMEDLKIHDISCSSSGYITIAHRSGSLISMQIQKADAITLTVQKSSTLHLNDQLFAPRTSKNHGSSVLSLGGSLVLFAGAIETKSEVAILLWDLQYSVVLASHTFPIPPTVERAKEGIRLELITASSGHVLLSVSPSRSETGSTCRSSVLVVPIQAPPSSTIANAMGRAASSAQWLKKPGQSSSNTNGLDKSQSALLESMRTAVQQKRPEAADVEFSKWWKLHESSKNQSSHKFIRLLLEVVLPASKSNLYSPKVVHQLIERHTVSSSMVEGGLVPALLECNDWAGIILALRNVRDIPETHLVSALRTAVLAQRRTSDPNAMDVDSSLGEVPPLAKILAPCVSYPTSAPALRLALRQHLNEAENVNVVLELLGAWLHSGSHIEQSLETAVSEFPATKKPSAPPFDETIIFIRTVLDTFFLTLLQYPPSYSILRSISARLGSELALVEEVEDLRGPLEPFTRARAKADTDAALGRPQPVDWRRRRKAALEQAAIGVELYQVEELVI